MCTTVQINDVPGLRYPWGFPGEFPMKTHNIEIQRFKAISHSNGLINAQVDALVMPLKPTEDRTPTSWLSMTEENARVLMALLKQQFAEIDKTKPRSRRS